MVQNRSLLSVLKDNCYELAKPIVNIINSSIIEGHFPSVWKRAHVTPVLKTSKVADPGKDLRPISVTSPLAKIFESHLNGILLEQIKANLDDRHFGSAKGSSTTAALPCCCPLSILTLTTQNKQFDFAITISVKGLIELITASLLTSFNNWTYTHLYLFVYVVFLLTDSKGFALMVICHPGSVSLQEFLREVCSVQPFFLSW